MLSVIRRFLTVAMLGCGVALGAAPAQAQVEAVPAWGVPMVQQVQYYGRGVPPYAYGRPFYGHPYDRGYPRYDARRFYRPPPPRFYGRPYDHHRFEGRGYDRHRFYR